MGAGDWNDGMNLVGAGGKGESVWLAFFLIAVLTRFAPLARERADTGVRRRTAKASRRRLRQRIEAIGLGRRVVSARLLRRRHATRLGDQR